MPYAAYSDPSAYGGMSRTNLAVWMGIHLLFEGKMRAIFCMLFGASAIILTSRAERRARGGGGGGGGVEIADIYYRRTLWLTAFGVLHAYLIWPGDILFQFGVVGLMLFPFRKLSGRTLCIIGALLLTFHSAQAVRGVQRFSQMTATATRYQALRTSGRKLTDEQETELKEIDEIRQEFKPGAQAIARDINTARSGYIPNLGARARAAGNRQAETFYRFMFWDIAGMLILGMGLMKLGFFDASRPLRFYIGMAIIGYGIGLPLDLFMATLWRRSGFDWVAMFRYIRVPGDFVRLAIALGHIAVIMIICKTGVLKPLTRALARVGRMALSNYLLTSVLCTLFFYGYGLGMYGKLQRYELLYVLAGMWAINLLFSALWLKHFRFGPMEWVWRSLTYAKLQPMRLA
jgi:uncharacterized protein